MSEPNEPAFPVPINDDPPESHTGMTLRQWMCGQVAASDLWPKGMPNIIIAAQVCDLADVILAAEAATRKEVGSE